MCISFLGLNIKWYEINETTNTENTEYSNTGDTYIVAQNHQSIFSEAYENGLVGFDTKYKIDTWNKVCWFCW